MSTKQEIDFEEFRAIVATLHGLLQKPHPKNKDWQRGLNTTLVKLIHFMVVAEEELKMKDKNEQS